MIILKNARFIDPASRTDEIRDILVAEGKIIRMGEELGLDASMIASAKGERLHVVDCRGLVAAPGLVDVHVHLREPGFTYKEDIESAAAAAAAGGFTSIIGMANTNPPIDSEEGILYVLKRGRKCPIRIRTCATITRGMQGQELVDMKYLRECGAAGFTDDGKPILNADLAREAMRIARGLKTVLSFHEEDPRYIRENGINHGEVSERLGLYGSEARAEYSMIERDCKLARETGATVNIQHISTKEGVELVRKAKKLGAKVFAEAAPHHFALTQEAVLQYGTNAKMNPPLRTEQDRLAIIEGLKDGTIEIIATDHAPHSKEEKEREYDQAPSGIIGLETALSLGIMHLVEPGHLTLSQLIARMSYHPAKLYNLDAGVLKEDALADIVVFDPAMEWEYSESRSKSNNTPWLGSRLRGRVLLTICAGRVVHDIREECKKTG